jgi:hypothetical protein
MKKQTLILLALIVCLCSYKQDIGIGIHNSSRTKLQVKEVERGLVLMLHPKEIRINHTNNGLTYSNPLPVTHAGNQIFF